MNYTRSTGQTHMASVRVKPKPLTGQTFLSTLPWLLGWICNGYIIVELCRLVGLYAWAGHWRETDIQVEILTMAVGILWAVCVLVAFYRRLGKGAGI